MTRTKTKATVTVTVKARKRSPTFRTVLRRWGACGMARYWVGTMTLTEAWRTCQNVSWMRWLLGRLRLDPNCTCDGEGSRRCAVVVYGRLDAAGLRRAFPSRTVQAAFRKRLKE